VSLFTSIDRTTVAGLVFVSLREVIAQSGQQAPAEFSEQTTLLGRNAVLDSLGMVTLIVELEQQLEEQYNRTLTLANDRAMSQKNSPFRTVETLTDYICGLLAEESTNG